MQKFIQSQAFVDVTDNFYIKKFNDCTFKKNFYITIK